MKQNKQDDIRNKFNPRKINEHQEKKSRWMREKEKISTRERNSEASDDNNFEHS